MIEAWESVDLFFEILLSLLHEIVFDVVQSLVSDSSLLHEVKDIVANRVDDELIHCCVLADFGKVAIDFFQERIFFW